MITEFKIFERIKLGIAYYYLIPYSDKNLIKLVLEKEKVKLKLYETRMNTVIKEINDAGDDIMEIYVLISDKEFVGYWMISKSEEKRSRKEFKKFIEEENAEYKGKLELEPYEIAANKYNL